MRKQCSLRLFNRRWTYSAEELAGATGLDPAASCVTGRRSNQLNYAPAFDEGQSLLFVPSGSLTLPKVPSDSLKYPRLP
jgi:hypothetical protein